MKISIQFCDRLIYCDNKKAKKLLTWLRTQQNLNRSLNIIINLKYIAMSGKFRI